MNIVIEIENGEGDFIDISNDVFQNSIAVIRSGFQTTNYDIGSYRVSDFSFKVVNNTGKYRNSGVSGSIFNGSMAGRDKKKVRVYRVDFNQYDSRFGVARFGKSRFGSEAERRQFVFEGLIKDEQTIDSSFDSTTTFKVLGIESVLNETLASGLANGQTAKAIIEDCLDLALVGYLSRGYSPSTVVTTISPIVDDVSSLNGLTCREVIEKMLLITNSYMLTRYNVSSFGEHEFSVIARTNVNTASFTFYGQSSNNGVENIVSMSNIESGLARTYNVARWDDGTTYSDNSSVVEYGVRKLNISEQSVTNAATKATIGTSIVNSYKTSKKELKLSTILDSLTIALGLNDVVNIDYPKIAYAPSGENIPIYGISYYGLSVYPYSNSTLEISPNENWEILGVEIDLKRNLISYNLRRI